MNATDPRGEIHRCADCPDAAVGWGHNRWLCDECLWEEELADL